MEFCNFLLISEVHCFERHPYFYYVTREVNRASDGARDLFGSEADSLVTSLRGSHSLCLPLCTSLRRSTGTVRVQCLLDVMFKKEKMMTSTYILLFVSSFGTKSKTLLIRQDTGAQKRREEIESCRGSHTSPGRSIRSLLITVLVQCAQKVLVCSHD